MPIGVVDRHDWTCHFAELAGERDLGRGRQLLRREEHT
jgi:hypothetical protein